MVAYPKRKPDQSACGDREMRDAKSVLLFDPVPKRPYQDMTKVLDESAAKPLSPLSHGCNPLKEKVDDEEEDEDAWADRKYQGQYDEDEYQGQQEYYIEEEGDVEEEEYGDEYEQDDYDYEEEYEDDFMEDQVRSVSREMSPQYSYDQYN